MRIVVLLALASPAAADNHVTTASADLLVAPRLKETVVVMGRFGLPHAHVETARMDLVDLYDDSLFDIRMSFLAGGFRFERPRWGFTVGAYLGTVWTETVRYFTPFGTLRVGASDDVHVTFEARSQGMYLAGLEDTPARALMRDFDLEARLVTPGRWARWEVRTRYRDVDVGQTRVRDAVVCTGLRLAIARRDTRWLPVFVGLGVRQERWRDVEVMGDVPAPTAQAPAWQTLLWFSVDFGAEGRLWPK